MNANLVELYVSPNGDRWLLVAAANDHPVVRHVPSTASGGRSSDLSLSAFLSADGATPQQDALLRLISRLALPLASACSTVPVDVPALHRPTADDLLLTAARVRTFASAQHLTNASGFFFARDERLFLVTSRHVVNDEPSKHFPDRLDIELHVDRDNLGASTWFSMPLFSEGVATWRQGSDDGGSIDVAVLEIHKARLPSSAVFNAFTPEHLPKSGDAMPIGASVLIVGFPLGFHDSLHHLPVVRQGVVASAFGLRFQGKGCFITDARTHRGTSGAPVVMSKPLKEQSAMGESLPWTLLGVHSSTIDMGSRDLQVDETLGLNSAWYADILMTLTEH